MWRERRLLARGSWIFFFCLAILAEGASQTASKSEGKETSSKSEVKAGLVRVSHELEKRPFDAFQTDETKAAMVWLLGGHDVHSSICIHVLGDFYASKYKHSKIVTGQLILASGAFIVDNPDQASDQIAVNLAGVEGVLKTYASILSEKPKDKSKDLDELIQKQSAGKLAEFVRDTVEKNCGPVIKLGT